MTERKSDIVIVGAGIAGCIAALALCRHYDVVVVDKLAKAKSKVGECLPPAASRILKKLDLLHLLQSPEHLTCHGMVSFWGSETPTIVDNVKNPDGLGWHLHRQHFEQQLRDELVLRGVTLLSSAKLTNIVQAGSTWQLQVEGKGTVTSITSSLLIDATGRASHLARQLGAKLQQFDKQMALWLTAEVATTKQFAVISDEENGWWYSAPSAACLRHNQCMQPRVFSWQASAEVIKKSKITTAQHFLSAVRQVRGFNTLVELVALPSAQLQPMVSANSARLDRCAGQGWYAVGDASMSFDPLSSQGMLHAMTSSMQLADMLLLHSIDYKHGAKLYQSQMDRVWMHYLAHRQHFYEGSKLINLNSG
ncbi:NAD(P)/FAD-dependent oxidoreductase [Pseudoalteromonas piscicida]|uniref:FAD-binding monooxygenase n=1 Tax=Pseudoalteromonas piscicida TaxID=43662 RepID=A0A2A5JUW9_PSEO7|nr:tryptophan 7-halogenase [Pseudoalteromonas piscicida]PCK33147.1 FAD-binding monooxygenase [Pseudoalteromonas piscicida]